MSRPQLIRADTIDLQDHTSPSAQDHSRQPQHPGALGAGPPAPHQAETLREVAAEADEEQHRSPRLSNDWTNSQQHFDVNTSNSAAEESHQQQDTLAVAQNGGLTGTEDADMADAEGDDGMDDDMMDKISSSPSIDDGGYPLPVRSATVGHVILHSPQLYETDVFRSSLPFLETPEHYPLSFRVPSLRREKPVERVVQSDRSSEYTPTRIGNVRTATESAVKPKDFSSPIALPKMESSSDLSTPSGKLSSTYTDEHLDVLAPLPGDLIEKCVESYDDDFEGEISDLQFGNSSEADNDTDLEQYLKYDESLMIPYESSEDDYDDRYDDRYDDNNKRFLDSGWGGDSLQNLEDIDFEFVYALHTFVATVEGQANATKGDTMVLLDDSNSYWWLVRVVKDSSIGYLPAEHIETPTERLARLNKHRNMDLSTAMLGDQESKSKNPLKKAMNIRRRNAKTVTFSAPTYVEASDIDYSTDEEGEGEYFAPDQQQASQQNELEDDEKTLVEPAFERTEARDDEGSASEMAARKNGDNTQVSSDTARSSDEIVDGEKTSGKSRNGTVRNTDSFFKDDTVETRKITLTPNLLRDDSSTSTTRTSNDSKEVRQRPSIDKLEKDSVDKSKDDKKKKEKKEKEKKPGMLSTLFSRKKKKSPEDEDVDELIYGKKASSDNARTSPAPSNDSGEFVAEEAPQAIQQSPQRQSSKLQKQPRADAALATNKSSNLTSEVKSAKIQQAPAPERPPPASSSIEPSMRMVRSESQEPAEVTQQIPLESPELIRSAQSSQDDTKSAGSLSKILRARSLSNSDPKPEKLKKAKFRSELDDFDSSVDSSPIEEQAKDETMHQIRENPVRPSIPGAYPDSYSATPTGDKPNPMKERLSESPVHVSPVEVSRNNPPALIVDTSSQEDAHSQMSSPSPELVDADEVRGQKGSVNSMSTPTSTSTWSDAHLRTFFDDDSEIKDLLVVVYDKSGVVPAGPDHPITGNLFKEENAKLVEITNRLDGMLGDWLARKSKVSAR